MKRRELIRHLERFGCVLLREGAKHSRYVNLADPRRIGTGHEAALTDAERLGRVQAHDGRKLGCAHRIESGGRVDDHLQPGLGAKRNPRTTSSGPVSVRSRPNRPIWLRSDPKLTGALPK